MFEIEYEFREKDLLHFNEMRFKKQEDIQHNIRLNRWIVPAVMIFIGTFYYYYYADRNTLIYISIIAVLWGVFSTRFIYMDLRRQVLKNYTDKEKNDMFGTYTLSIDPQNPKFLQENSPSGKHKMAWEELLRVEYGKGYVYIYISLSTALVIPVETVKKGDLQEFAEQAKKMIERFS